MSDFLQKSVADGLMKNIIKEIININHITIRKKWLPKDLEFDIHFCSPYIDKPFLEMEASFSDVFWMSDSFCCCILLHWFRTLDMTVKVFTETEIAGHFARDFGFSGRLDNVLSDNVISRTYTMSIKSRRREVFIWLRFTTSFLFYYNKQRNYDPKVNRNMLIYGRL